ncbi:acyl-CoA dehydrogenase family protein [Streptomyces sp. NPDC018693]|uniref:acyl-CoA dehydrogenase family protein n=1 Tax=unclassified Streptomyces TaxID=2593676 RepID=UPI00378D84DD
MRFRLDPEQRAFAASLDALLTAADTPSVIRDWSRGDPRSGRALWRRIAEAGVFALAVPEAYEGLGPRPVDLAVAFMELGRHAVPGPLTETIATATLLTALEDPALNEPAAAATDHLTARTIITPTRGPHTPDDPGAAPDPGDTGHTTSPADPRPDPPADAPPDPPADATAKHPPPNTAEGKTAATLPQGPHHPDDSGTTTHPVGPAFDPPADATAKQLLPALTRGEVIATLTQGPYALDADVAEVRLRGVGGDEVWLLPPAEAAPRPTPDPARRLSFLPTGGELLACGPHVGAALARAVGWARLATAAQALGVGLALLDRTVGYVGQRSQFGVPVGSFQAVKHRLADARTALEFARPLVFGAALTLAPADVAAAKVAACEAAYATARTALQLHGAIGYTAEYDLSLWLTRAAALRTAWGAPHECRDVVLSGRA